MRGYVGIFLHVWNIYIKYIYTSVQEGSPPSGDYRFYIFIGGMVIGLPTGFWVVRNCFISKYSIVY